MLRLEAVQQAHESVTLDLVSLFRHSLAWVSNVVVLFSHPSMKVALGWGKLAVLQEALTLSSQSKSVLVRFASCLAPSLP